MADVVPWYIAESRDRVLRYAHGVSDGRACEGYDTPEAGTVFVHRVQMTQAEIDSLRRLVTEEGIVSERLAMPGEQRWWFSKGGKARWPGTNVHARFEKLEGAKWRPKALDDATLAKLRDV